MQILQHFFIKKSHFKKKSSKNQRKTTNLHCDILDPHLHLPLNREECVENFPNPLQKGLLCYPQRNINLIP